MAKVRTLLDLQDALDREWSWRIFELTVLKGSLGRKHGKAENSLLRANVSMLYAHWEGFIKQAAGHYLEFVSRKGLRSRTAADAFTYLSLKRTISDFHEVRNPSVGLEIFRQLKAVITGNEPVRFSTSVDTGSNLNSVRFQSILASVNVDQAKYLVYFNLIDELLLARRNSIAHGEFLDIDEASFLQTYSDTIMLMRWFKDDLENAATLASYEIGIR